MIRCSVLLFFKFQFLERKIGNCDTYSFSIQIPNVDHHVLGVIFVSRHSIRRQFPSSLVSMDLWAPGREFAKDDSDWGVDKVMGKHVPIRVWNGFFREQLRVIPRSC